MSISDAAENSILDLIFRATAWANYADNASSSPQTQIGLSLHTGDPGEAGDATTNEVGYTSYTRLNVARSTGFTAAALGATSLAAIASFPAGTGGSGTATNFATSKSNATPPTGAQPILFSGTLTPAVACGNGVTPRLLTSSTISLD